MSAFLRFAAVGAAGFLVNEAALYVAIHFLHLGKGAAWLFAFVPAVTFTWWGNRMLTFRAHASANWMREWAKFVATNSLGAAINFAVYAALIYFAAFNPMIALAAGVVVAMLFNFTLSKKLVFKAKTPPPLAGG